MDEKYRKIVQIMPVDGDWCAVYYVDGAPWYATEDLIGWALIEEPDGDRSVEGLVLMDTIAWPATEVGSDMRSYARRAEVAGWGVDADRVREAQEYWQRQRQIAAARARPAAPAPR